MADEPAAPAAGRVPRSPGKTAVLVRYAVGVLVGLLVFFLLFGKRTEFTAAWRQLGSAALAWVVAAIVAEAASMVVFAWLQQRVLRLSGARLGLPGMLLVTLANEAISNTVPGEPAVSSAYRYRFYRRRGASGASAGWTIFTILIAQAIGMSLLLLIGVIIALAAGAGGASIGVTVVGLVVVGGAVAVLIRRDLVLRLMGAAVRGLRRLTGHPRGHVGARIDATLRRMREIPLSGRATVALVIVATSVWGCDFACLVFSFRAVHSSVPWHGVLLAYGAAQVIASLPVVPGGLGLVEGGLAVVLVAYGAGRVPAVAAALAYRIISFWLAITVGWLSAGLIAALHRAADKRKQPQDQEGNELVVPSPPSQLPGHWG